MRKLYKRMITITILCVVLLFSFLLVQKRLQTTALSREKLIASLPEEEIFFYFSLVSP